MWDYGFGLDVLGLIVEQLTEQSLGRYLQENVFKPLGMVDTHFVLPQTRSRATPRRCRSIPTPAEPQSLRSFTEPTKFECGGGCDGTTANDYLRFALMLANKGTYANQRILSRKTVEYMTANHLGPDVVNTIARPAIRRARLRFRAGVAVPHPARDFTHHELGRHLRLAGRQRHQLVGRSAKS